MCGIVGLHLKNPGLQPRLGELLTQMLKDGEPDVRWNAALTLGNMKAAARDAVPALIEALNELPGVEIHFVQAESRRVGAANYIGDLGPAARAAQTHIR